MAAPLRHATDVLLARLRHPRLDADLTPLGTAASACLPGGLPHALFQEDEARASGLTLIDVDAAAVLPAGTRAVCTSQTVFSAATLTALLAAARDGAAQAGIKRGTALWEAATRVRPLAADAPFALWAGRLEGERVDLDAENPVPRARLAVVCDEEGARNIAVRPHGRAPHVLALPDVNRLGGTFAHWLDVLELSLAALQLVRRRRGVGDRRSAIGDADVHPTALIEGSIVEDGARIEAHASVIGSFVGRDCHIADHACVVDSVLGAATRTLVDTSMRRVVSLGDGTVSNLNLADVVVGPGVFVTTAVSFFGPDPGRDVVVDGVDTRRPVLGGAIGARAILGARALFAAGAAIPAGALVVARPDEAATKLDAAGLSRAAMRLGDRSSDV